LLTKHSMELYSQLAEEKRDEMASAENDLFPGDMQTQFNRNPFAEGRRRKSTGSNSLTIGRFNY